VQHAPRKNAPLIALFRNSWRQPYVYPEPEETGCTCPSARNYSYAYQDGNDEVWRAR
jgi:hypothetical protein